MSSRIKPERVELMHNIARHHLNHERYHSAELIDEAVRMKRHANTLKVLADQLSRAEPLASGSATFKDPLFRAAGASDLNDLAGVTMTGVLFMEGEDEPREIGKMRRDLEELAREQQRIGGWLREKMDAGWQRDVALLTRDYAETAYDRLSALTQTTLTGIYRHAAGRLAELALTGLSSTSFTAEAVRNDTKGTAAMARTISYLLDRVSFLLAHGGAGQSLSDPHWTRAVEGLSRGKPGTEQS